LNYARTPTHHSVRRERIKSMMVRHAGAAGWREMVTSPETAVSEMEMAMKVEELNMEPRELMLDELDDASGGFIVPLCVGAFIARSTCG